MNERILYTKPSITELEIGYATDAATNGWGERCYEYIDRFERLFREYLGVKYAIATSSCTGALHMGMAALGVGAGDEVILADSNWIASVAPVIHLGATPVFVDILPDSWCLDPDLVEAAITPRTKAILAVHLYGNLCHMTQLLEIGKRYGIPVIEDAAEAIGSIYHGQRAGSMGRFGAFSFHGTKTMTTGEGGMFVTNDDDLYERVLTLSNHGRARGQTRQFWPETVGYKYKMSNIQAAIGCGQMERIEELVSRKRAILECYRRELLCFDGVKMNPEPSGTINGAWMPTILIEKSGSEAVEQLKSKFNTENIDARVFFHPLSSLPMFIPKKCNALAKFISESALNLPSYHDMSDESLDKIIKIIRSVLKSN
ncbi:glutamine--scyllo-inositol aminotransferase [Aeromonas sp. YN13HZO-058]|uniref:DegT/DnrJ/EryC1/StrS family aminotransferase n=1 Tax=Aeromonas sp. YN13HZO-058 TaxID=1921564 RepID=UPI000946BBC9|nr:DegT/DnrJ/EryC1/StrS aminotransferase family protein [Aeromonas sp. YN13HZO-058]OLF22423.1 glutamine--scyllo-inositol aminotransferase [Aeromonas sp. YN13HZO-058]BBT80989.1 glutamine--scyllo-inositol aminotransferase [Aeromonas veronii]